MGFSRQEHWSGLPFPSPTHESEKWKRSRSVVSDSLRPHGLQPTRLLHPWDFPGKSTGVGCHCLLRFITEYTQLQWCQWLRIFFAGLEARFRKAKITCYLAASRLQPFPMVSPEERKFKMWKHRVLAPDSWGAHQTNDYSESRLWHLPIQRKALNSVTWHIWFL